MSLKRFWLRLGLSLAAAVSFATDADAAYVPGCTVALTIPGAVAHEFKDVVIQPDGKIVAAGYVDFSGPNNRDFLVARFHPDLTLDLTFNAPKGYRTDDLWTLKDEIYAVTIQTDQKIVVVGAANFSGSQRYMAVARYRRDGTLDPSFSSNGWHAFDFDFASFTDELLDVAMQPDGKIVATGHYTASSNPKLAVVRFTQAGVVDASFTGTKPVIPGNSTGTGILVERDGKLVLSVTRNNGATLNDFAAVRLDGLGNLDPTFNGTGFSTVDVGTNTVDTTSALLRQPDGSILVAGTSAGDMAVVRFTSSGVLDAGFGTGGRALHDFGNADAGHDAAFDGGGNIVVAGEATPSSLDLAVTRFKPTGLFDFAFTNDVTGLADRAFAVAITRLGKILLAGSSGGGPSPVSTLALFNPDGTQTCGPLLHPVEVFTASVSGDGASGRVMLNWLNPGSGLYDETIVRIVPGCPAMPTDGTLVVAQNDGLGNAGAFTDFVPIGPTYHYAAFVEDAANNPSPVACVAATPFDSTARNTEWIYGTGIATMTTPGLRVDGLAGESVAYTVGNDGLAHAIAGGPVGSGGGAWPAGWKPYRLNAAAPDRPLILPLPPSNKLTMVTGAEDGRVYAIDAVTGELQWLSPKLGGMIVGSPATVLTLYGGAKNYVFVGTRDSGAANRFYALNANDGTVAWYFDNGGGASGIGLIVSAAVVSYGAGQVYFTSLAGSSGRSLWCLDYATTPPGPCSGWGSFGVFAPGGGSVETSPILYKGIHYVSEDNGDLVVVDPSTGVATSSYPLGGTGANGYVFPKFYEDVIFASTATTLWVLATNPPVGPASPVWSEPLLAAPSIPLYIPGTDEVYVATTDGNLLRFSALSGGPPTRECIGDCTTTGVGSPALDLFRRMIYVGTDGGQVHGVRTPF